MCRSTATNIQQLLKLSSLCGLSPFPSQVRRWTTPKRLKANGQASESVLDCDRIIMPVHEGVHWTCAMVDLQHKQLVFFDSLMGEDRKLLKHLETWIKEEAQVRGHVSIQQRRDSASAEHKEREQRGVGAENVSSNDLIQTAAYI